ncbi:MAG: hypothetical protein HYZ11_09020 [Candidatus Tectomicrobia bacterium]|uniref:Uncharacterized protein n=1 Tax=Tectimicrobiota bacterium TaxID=2528274 RepID=A0A932I0L7_UNCTE|nr:hypothetical protein [Candidatus Tectomicrobia bacterium]
MGWDWTSPEDLLLFLGLMIALIFFRAWNTNRKMRRLRGLFDGGRYERKGTGIIATRYIGRFRGRRAVLSFDPPGWGRPGNFDIEVACRAPWGFYARTLLREKIAGWYSGAGREADPGDPELKGKLAFHSDTPGALAKWLGEPEVRALVTGWLLGGDAVFLALRESRDLKERALLAAYITRLPARTEAEVRPLLERLARLAERAEGVG